MSRLWPLLLAAGLLTSGAASQTPERGYRMGFTPFPWDATFEAVGWVREFVGGNADVLAAHLEGVPWTEAAEGTPFSRAFEDRLGMTLAALPEGAPVYLAVSPLDILRGGLAEYYGEREGMPLPEPFAGLAFDDPVVQRAYLAYVERMVERCHPSWLNIGIEANELRRNSPELWEGYLRLHRATYAALKQAHPELPVFVSVTLHDLVNRDRSPELRAACIEGVRELLESSDLLAVSYYPFLHLGSRHVAEALGWLDTWFGDLGKPFAIAESGELAEPLYVAEHDVTIPGDPATQRDSLQSLLDYADAHDTGFVIWFLTRDYDDLYERMRESAPSILRIWRDCGLVDGDGALRPAGELWRERLARPMAE